jgi:hypothetical protein
MSAGPSDGARCSHDRNRQRKTTKDKGPLSDLRSIKFEKSRKSSGSQQSAAVNSLGKRSHVVPAVDAYPPTLTYHQHQVLDVDEMLACHEEHTILVHNANKDKDKDKRKSSEQTNLPRNTPTTAETPSHTSLDAHSDNP